MSFHGRYYRSGQFTSHGHRQRSHPLLHPRNHSLRHPLPRVKPPRHPPYNINPSPNNHIRNQHSQRMGPLKPLLLVKPLRQTTHSRIVILSHPRNKKVMGMGLQTRSRWRRCRSRRCPILLRQRPNRESPAIRECAV